ncbi:MAG: aminoacyl-tRNA hydrolase [Burkholderiales bacterium]|jgi:PTH1 family peptidyl-tRNA hydrolase|nr:aminoacyl-tRNA hydrolase [Burkholderiales bacterium]
MTHFRLIVGLGNIGRDYEATRHNVGFWWVDALAQSLGARFSQEAKFFGEIAKVNHGLRLIKPTTYMNLSGRSVTATAHFFAIAPEEILVVHDDLDLAPGVVRLKQGGGFAGHNGLRDIATQLGDANFWRLRFGIGHPRDSETPRQPVADYVLKSPPLDELRAIENAIRRALDAWSFLEKGNTADAMQSLHAAPDKPPPQKTIIDKDVCS